MYVLTKITRITGSREMEEGYDHLRDVTDPDEYSLEFSVE